VISFERKSGSVGVEERRSHGQRQLGEYGGEAEPPWNLGGEFVVLPDPTLAPSRWTSDLVVLVCAGSPVGRGRYAGRESVARAEWLASMPELARCPNVTVKLGGILMSLANFDFRVADRPPTSTSSAACGGPTSSRA
jgi:hypothetical protein